MRVRHLGLILLAATASVPAIAQPAPIERRVGKLEQEMRAVQRKVFPGGNVEPEIRPETPVAGPIGDPSSSAVADLTGRVDSLESQLARLTGQIEENSNKLRQLDAEVARLRAEAEQRAAAPAPARMTSPNDEAQSISPAEEPRVTPDAPSSSSSAGADPAEDAYLTGFRLWEQKRYTDAQGVLTPIAKQWPRHRRASWAQNLLGRAYLDDGKPASAAKVFLANYQANPKGERAADSLYFLGQSLVQLKKPAEACKVYEELQDVYPTMRDWVKQRLPKARADAKCNG
jgi:TolA-binding protein